MAKHRPTIPNPNKKPKVEYTNGIPNKEGFDILYDRYVARYNAAKGKLGRGEQMYSPLKRKAEFKDLWLAIYNQNKKDGTLKGNSSAETANWLVNQVVEEQRFFRSREQAAGFKQGLEFFGVASTIHGIRGGSFEAELNQYLIGDKSILSELNRALKRGDLEFMKQYLDEEAIEQAKANLSFLLGDTKNSGYARENYFG
jgi:hypothetical protein